MNYNLKHGVGSEKEIYGKALFVNSNYKLYISKIKDENYMETVINYLTNTDFKPYSYFYLRGNKIMITDCIEVLRGNALLRGQF